MKLTSVVIPAHNEQDYIKNTIDSFKEQHFKKQKTPYELVVVANGCDASDDTANISHDLGAKVIELEKANVSTARNIGVGSANGEIIVFNDADTLVAPNYLETIINVTDKKYDFGCALFKPENYHPLSILYSILAWGGGFVMRDAGGNMYARRSLFEKVGGFNPELKRGQDTDLSRRMKTAGGRYKFLHSTYVITSLRKFRENGYSKELFMNQVWPYIKSFSKKHI